jgi:lauroyl/myristoyl acyltransferase
VSGEQSPDFLRRLQLAEQPPARVRMPPVDLALRLKTSPSVRRVVPTRLAVARATRKGRRLWERNPGARAEAEAAMATILAATADSARLARLARAHLIEREAEKAIFWQPWGRAHLEPAAAARLRAALQSERGVLLSPCHMGPYPRISSALLHLGYPSFAVYGPWFFERPSPTLWGRRLARWRIGIGARLVRSTGSFAVVQTLLARGECVLVYFDMPGHRQTRFLGKPASLADGSARLAIASDALVLPVRARRLGHRMGLDVAEALDSRGFAGVAELHTALAQLHERWILELPATMADPRSFGWEGGARPDAWIAPDPRRAAPRGDAAPDEEGLPGRDPGHAAPRGDAPPDAEGSPDHPPPDDEGSPGHAPPHDEGSAGREAS